MKIAVTTPSGHIGSIVADHLVEAGMEVRLLARRPEKLRHFVERGAEVVRGSQDDADYLTWTTHGVDALFWVTPPSYGSDNLRAFQNRLGRAAAEAIRRNDIPRVVNISSIGADLDSGVGPICGLHDVEGILNEACQNVTHLRPGFFFENYLWYLDSMKEHGCIYLPLSGSTTYPMIACRDIARAATDRLMDLHWAGQTTRELHGPTDLSMDEAAQAISDGVGSKIVHVQIDNEAARLHMVATGMSDNACELMLELYEALEEGRLRPRQNRSLLTTTPTTLVKFAHQYIAPTLHHPISH